MPKNILNKDLKRSFTFSSIDKNAEENSYTFSFSSEQPVQRWFGTEILEHSNADNIDLTRLNDGGVLLWNHDSKGLPIGKINRSWLSLNEKKLYCSITFADLPDANNIKKLIDDGFLRNVSFGYGATQYKELPNETYLFTKWYATEISIVNLPADNTVGMGRNLDLEQDSKIEIIKENKQMSEKTEDKINIEEIRSAELARINEIIAISRNFDLEQKFTDEAITKNLSIDQVKSLVLDNQLKKQQVVSLGTSVADDLDLTAKEKRSYSILNATRAFISNDWSKAGFEREISKTLENKRGINAQGFLMPTNINWGNSKRAYDKAGGSSLIATDLLANEFIELLRNKCMVLQLGARMLSGLVGNVDIPTQISSASAAWINETGTVSESSGAFSKKSMTGGKHLVSLAKITRDMLQQSTPDIESLVRDDLLNVMALALDSTALYGTGTSNQPLGIAGTSGINSVIGGTNGAAITIEHLIDMETAIAVANYSDANLSYLTNPKIVGALKKLKSTTGEYLWRNGSDDGMRGSTPNTINGYAVNKTNQCRSNLTKGSGTNLSEIYFGDFSQLIIGEWGVLDILPNALGSGYSSGAIELRVMQTLDMLVRQPKAFSIMTDAIA